MVSVDGCPVLEGAIVAMGALLRPGVIAHRFRSSPRCRNATVSGWSRRRPGAQLGDARRCCSARPIRYEAVGAAHVGGPRRRMPREEA